MYQDKAKPTGDSYVTELSLESILTDSIQLGESQAMIPRNLNRLSFNRRPNSPQEEPNSDSKSKGQGGEPYHHRSSRKGTPASPGGKRRRAKQSLLLCRSWRRNGTGRRFHLSVGRLWEESAAAGFDCFRSIGWVAAFSCAGQAAAAVSSAYGLAYCPTTSTRAPFVIRSPRGVDLV